MNVETLFSPTTGFSTNTSMPTHHSEDFDLDTYKPSMNKAIEQNANRKKCQHCGSNLAENAIVCWKCGEFL